MCCLEEVQGKGTAVAKAQRQGWARGVRGVARPLMWLTEVKETARTEVGHEVSEVTGPRPYGGPGCR